ncbi:MAG: 3'-5' exonuclease, partial [Pseudomonadota bacterium]
FPSQRALDEGGLASLEEERRLAYVAITRARRLAIILHAANRRIYGQWTSSIPSRFVGELPAEHHTSESTMSGGASLWQANWSERADPFADVQRGTGRGPGWQRAAGYDPKAPGGAFTSRTFTREAPRVLESRASAVSFGAKPRGDLSLGLRVFHQKFGYGVIAEIEGNKLEIDFETAGRKRVMDSFVSVG